MAFPSNTVTVTPIVNSIRAPHSSLDGTFFSTSTATAAVTTGREALQDSLNDWNDVLTMAEKEGRKEVNYINRVMQLYYTNVQ